MARPTRIRYTIVLLALLIDMMSYMDRVCIAVAGPSIEEQFALSKSQMGAVFSIFSLAYFLGQTPWGMVADRVGARGIVTAAILWWSAFTAFTATTSLNDHQRSYRLPDDPMTEGRTSPTRTQ